MYLYDPMSMYADIILPVPLNQLFTYLVPDMLRPSVQPGARVYVPFGKGRRLTGIIVRTHTNRPTSHAIKEIQSVLDSDRPSVLPLQLKLIKWMADYCMCTPGDVMKAALPSGLRPDSGSNEHTYKPHTEVYVKPGLKAKDYLSGLCDDLIAKTAIKQKELFDKYVQLSGLKDNPLNPAPVTRKTLTAFCKTPSSFRALIENGLLDLYELETGRLPHFSGHVQEPPVLSPAQQKALSEIKDSFKTKNVCLLHGVTSSGKTEIYINLIKEQIAKGGQVLYLLPEIALTTQIMHRLQKVLEAICVSITPVAQTI